MHNKCVRLCSSIGTESNRSPKRNRTSRRHSECHFLFHGLFQSSKFWFTKLAAGPFLHQNLDTPFFLGRNKRKKERNHLFSSSSEKSKIFTFLRTFCKNEQPITGVWKMHKWNLKTNHFYNAHYLNIFNRTVISN
ncbi:hypothetical protein CEXT_525351 [Caerostris extrusa]|uniref:Uncharacterized protein n=1 Tax=Caerostris extrusa TaxID=172846 RepID=A0AAV4MQC6_CAEEX|nr:hypothetical protein CEXT_525351 [Caerostris extrusa]